MPEARSDTLNDEQLMHAMSVDDAYRIERVLGSGAYDVTELVTIEGSGPFVRKKIKAEQARRGVWAALSECRSRYLPRVWATYEMPEEFVVVCDYVPGEALRGYVERTGRVPLDTALSLAGTVCEAALELHRHGVIHRDITPSNVIVSSDGAHLIDLGIARLKGDVSSDGGSALGTWGFAAPEQYGFARTDERSDVYSIGRLLGFLLTGAMPQGEGFAGPFFDERVVPRDIRAVIERACAFEPSARYQDAAQLARALAAARGDGVPPTSERKEEAGHGAPAGLQQPAGPCGQDAECTSGQGGRPRRGRGAVAAWAVGGSVAALVCIAVAATLLFGGKAADPAAESVSAQTGAFHGVEAPSGADGDAGFAGDPDAIADDVPLAVVDSGWSADGFGYVHYAFALQNGSDEFAVLYPQISVTGRSEDGTVLFSSVQALPKSLPGQTLFFAGIAGNGTAPDVVEFAPLPPEAWNVERSTEEGWALSVPAPVSVVPDGLGGVSFTGDVRCESDAGIPSEASMAAVSVVLRDGEGKIVWGDATFVGLPAEGETTPFSLPAYDLPDYETVEAHALPW